MEEVIASMISRDDFGKENMDHINLEELLFSYVEKIKVLISPKTWENIILDCSKNELFILFFLYRKKEANMSQLAEYIEVPLNTVTGIVDRMEKRKLLLRQRSPEDKRVVTVCMTTEGVAHISDITKEILKYAQIVMDKLSSEEIAMIFQISDKIVTILEEAGKQKEEKQTVQKIKKIPIE